MTGSYIPRTAVKPSDRFAPEPAPTDTKTNLIQLKQWYQGEPEKTRPGLAGLLFTAAGFVLGGLVGSVQRRFGLMMTPRSVTALQVALPALLGGSIGAMLAWVRAQQRLTSAMVTSEEFRRRLVAIERNHALWVSLSAVLHDVRNPLHNITLLLEGLEQPGVDGAQVRTQALEQLARINQRIRKVMDQVAEFSGEINLGVVRIAEVMRPVIEMVAPLAQQSGVEFCCDIGPSEAEVVADHDLLAQAIDHLALNSLQILSELPEATPGRLTLSLQDEAECLYLLVEDNGPGLPAPVQEHLFEPLTGPHSRGMGLGLAIAHALAHAAGAALEVGRTGADGTQFRLCLKKPVPAIGTVA